MSSLCFGWIDGQAKRIDDAFYQQRYTPRRKRSIWSKINTEKAAALTASGPMRPAGQAQIDAAKADGRWDAAYHGSATAQIPAEIAADPRALQAIEALNRCSTSSPPGARTPRPAGGRWPKQLASAWRDVGGRSPRRPAQLPAGRADVRGRGVARLYQHQPLTAPFTPVHRNASDTQLPSVRRFHSAVAPYRPVWVVPFAEQAMLTVAPSLSDPTTA